MKMKNIDLDVILLWAFRLSAFFAALCLLFIAFESEELLIISGALFTISGLAVLILQPIRTYQYNREFKECMAKLEQLDHELSKNNAK